MPSAAALRAASKAASSQITGERSAAGPPARACASTGGQQRGEVLAAKVRGRALEGVRALLDLGWVARLHRCLQGGEHGPAAAEEGPQQLREQLAVVGRIRACQLGEPAVDGLGAGGRTARLLLQHDTDLALRRRHRRQACGQRAEYVAEFVRAQRLAEEAVHTGSGARRPVLGQHARSDGHDRGPALRRQLGPDPASGPEPVQLRHLQVHQHDVVGRPLDSEERFQPVADRVDL